MNTAASMYKSYTPLPVQSGLLDLQCRSRSQLYTKRLTDNNPYSNGPGHLGHQKTTSMPGNLEKVVISSNSDSCKQESLEKTLHCLEQTSENSPFCVTCIKFKQELEKMTIQQKKLNEKCSSSEKLFFSFSKSKIIVLSCKDVEIIDSCSLFNSFSKLITSSSLDFNLLSFCWSSLQMIFIW